MELDDLAISEVNSENSLESEDDDKVSSGLTSGYEVSPTRG